LGNYDVSFSEDAFHPDTRALLDYGRAIASGRPAPSIKTADKLADRLFVIDGVNEGRANFLTFGSELISLFGRDLRRTDLLDLFLPSDRALLRALLNAVVASSQPGVVAATAEAGDGTTIGVEILATPLARGVLTGERLLGLVQPLGGESLLEGRAIKRIRLGAIYPPRAHEPLKPLRLVVSNS
jgi:hypothetical protein